MPARLDHVARREAIAEAAWRITRRDGLDAVSVRSVAAEAGLSTGSVRHIFATQADLLLFAMELVVARISQRIAAIDDHVPPRERIERMICEILPLDEDRAAENEVWLAFLARSRVEPSMQHLVERIDAAQRDWLRAALAAMFAEQGSRNRDPGREAERLYAMMDGLVLHAITAPGSPARDRMLDTVGLHLDDLQASCAGRVAL